MTGNPPSHGQRVWWRFNDTDTWQHAYCYKLGVSGLYQMNAVESDEYGMMVKMDEIEWRAYS